jgi:hypothetical protein
LSFRSQLELDRVTIKAASDRTENSQGWFVRAGEYSLVETSIWSPVNDRQSVISVHCRRDDLDGHTRNNSLYVLAFGYLDELGH